ncbi:SDR family NAD(P)-dependent oxidoreductase [Geothrix sp. PMB-07]|uniref:SDR family NAD(P)-dependent oxidoreductase n=1 Tax=Geothrix sp. PMB-07 TaxID=3068640 RepID=UPI0027429144|nr:SDR family NAD(P)-dependent oxidoreductase [Geothrix sp. PMB-07]WLT32577.1 SDR family NAD(P)-dependent oxidoreductase [Geothrix sp. PMB-07]
MRPEHPIVLITGASSGFGEAMARLLAANGCHLALGARRVERVQALADELVKAHGIKAFAGAVDTRETASVNAFVEAAATSLGGLHVLVANAGLASGTFKLWETPDEDLEAMMRTNVEGVVKTIRAGLPHVRKAGWGHVFFIGSTAGHQPYEGGSVYCASKFGVKAMAQTLRLEVNGEQIRVTSVDPGMAETEFSNVRMKDDAKAKAVYQGVKPLSAFDVAECVRWCLMLPDHVNIDEILVKCVDQASVHKVHRRA